MDVPIFFPPLLAPHSCNNMYTAFFYFFTNVLSQLGTLSAIQLLTLAPK